MREPRILAGRYRVAATLGHGAAGDLLRVEDTWCEDTPRALRLQEVPPTELQTRALESEYRILREIDHPLLPCALDFGRLPDARAYFTMEFVDGKEIHRAWASRSPTERFDLLERLCTALQAIHVQGFLHGNLGAGAILVSPLRPTALRVVALGHAVPIGTPTEELRTAPAYAAPELAAAGATRIQSDLYALGILLHRLFTGRLPYGDGAAALHKHQEAPVPDLARSWHSSPPTGLSPHAGTRLGELIGELMAKSPAERPTEAAEVARRLQDVGKTTGTDARARTRRRAAADAELRPRLVGRETVRDRLREALERVITARRPNLVVLRGPAGIGKTRLLDTVRTQWQLREGVMLEIFCDPNGAAPGRCILDRLITRLAQALPPDVATLEACGAELPKIAPSLADLPALRAFRERSIRWESTGRPLRPRAEWIRRWDRIAAFLILQAQRRPLWLTFREVEHDAEELPALLAALNRVGAAAPIVICATSTRETLPAWLAKPEVLGLAATQVSLDGLRQPETAELLSALMGFGGLLTPASEHLPTQITREIARGIHRQTGGHPQRIIDLARRFASGAAGDWQRAGTPETNATAADPSQRFKALLRALGPEAAHLLRILALGASPTPEAILTDARRRWSRGRKSCPSDSALDSLEALQQARWVIRSQCHAEPHWQLRDPRHASLLRTLGGPAERRTIHAELAAAWEARLRGGRTRPAPSIDALERTARHYLEAGDPEKALGFAMQAAAGMRELHANRRARDLLEDCRPVVKKLARRGDRQPRREIDLLLELAKLAEEVGDTGREAQLLRRLRSAALGRHLQAEESARVYRRQALLALAGGNRAAAAKLLRQANRLLGPGTPRARAALSESVEIATATAEMHLRNGAPEKALTVCRDTLAGVGMPETEIREGRLGAEIAALLGAAGLAQLDTGQPSDALQTWARAHRAYTLAGEVAGIADILTRLGKFHLDRGNLRHACGALSRAIAQRQKMHDLDGVADALNDLGIAELLSGKVAAAGRILNAGRQLRQRAGDRHGEMRSVASLGEVDLLAGSHGAAEERLTAALEFATQTGDICAARGLRMSLAAVWLATARRAKAEHALRHLQIELEDDTDLLSRGILHIRLGDCAFERHRESEARDPFVGTTRAAARKKTPRAAGRWLRRARAEYAEALTIFRDRPHRHHHGVAIARILQTHLAAASQATAAGPAGHDPGVTAARLAPEEVGSYFQALGRIATDLGSGFLEAWNLLLRGNDRLLNALAATGQTRGESLSIARSVFRDAHEIAQSHGLREILWQVQLGHARASRLAGHYRRAQNHLREALDLLQEMRREVGGKQSPRSFMQCGGRQMIEREVELLAGATAHLTPSRRLQETLRRTSG